jgi:hypothetical protein
MTAPAKTSAPCDVHGQHQPTSHINEIHHVWPLGAGGPNIHDNKVTVCATGHNSIHDLLNQWLKAKGDPGWDVQRHYTHWERHLAKLGYERIQRGAM